MRSIEAIKADIEIVKNIYIATLSDSELLEKIGEWVSLERELHSAITDGIPLDRLETICNAERDGRCVVLPHKKTTILDELARLEEPLGDMVETYRSGFVCGERNGKASMIRYLLKVPTVHEDAAEAALKGGDGA